MAIPRKRVPGALAATKASTFFLSVGGVKVGRGAIVRSEPPLPPPALHPAFPSPRSSPDRHPPRAPLQHSAVPERTSATARARPKENRRPPAGCLRVPRYSNARSHITSGFLPDHEAGGFGPGRARVPHPREVRRRSREWARRYRFRSGHPCSWIALIHRRQRVVERRGERPPLPVADEPRAGERRGGTHVPILRRCVGTVARQGPRKATIASSACSAAKTPNRMPIDP